MLRSSLLNTLGVLVGVLLGMTLGELLGVTLGELLGIISLMFSSVLR